ncbi:MAG: hypothetical protein ACTSVZ_09410, partial [Promethearchaeota archaeon]
MDKRIRRVMNIAEQIRKPKSEETPASQESEKSKEQPEQELAEKISEDQLDQNAVKLEKLRKIQRLQELEDELAKVEPEKDASLDELEEKLASQIKSATMGEVVLQESADESIISQEMNEIKLEVAQEQKVIVKTTYEKLVELHEWIEEAQYGFMYSKPHPKKAKNDFQSWREEWSQVLLDYARVGTIHIIFPKRLLTEEPFNKFVNRKDSISELCEALIDKDLAKWVGNKRKKDELRVYWKSVDEWTTIIEQWAYDNAIFDIIMIPDIRKSKEEFALLPIEDLRYIFQKLEKNHKGTMVEL